MKKIPTLYLRNPDNMRELLDEVHPDCQWVIDGEGVATRKYDGTCCLVRDGVLYKRREVKKGKAVPALFQEVGYDEVTGKRVGWIIADAVEPQDKWHMEAWLRKAWDIDGTYELLGPKIQGNSEGLEYHGLLRHAEATTYPNAPSNKEGLRDWLAGEDIEGIVWHHPDGRMAKIKKKDFGMKRR